MDQDNASLTPSGGQHSASSTPQGNTSASGSSTTPQPVPSGHGRAAASGSSSGAGLHNSKRRRGLGVVTPNACTECRKKRAKCDGRNPCGRCRTQKGVECVYEIPVRQSKENLRTEIEQLRQRQQSSDTVFEALARPQMWEEVISRLRKGQSIDSISEWLGTLGPSDSGPTSTFSSSHTHSGATRPQTSTPSQDYSSGSGATAAPTAGSTGIPIGMILSPNVMEQQHQQQVSLRGEMTQSIPWQRSSHSQPGSTRSSSVADIMSWSTDAHEPGSLTGYWSEAHRPEHMSEKMPRYRGIEQILSPLTEAEMLKPSETWTQITGDINLVHHLLALYFCWEYPTFASLSKEHFLRDFQEGTHRYCSPILVNALLALGCRFSTQPMTRANPNDPYSSGNHFFSEALRLYNNEGNHHSLSTIQALGIMAIREASCGRDSESWYYAGQSQRLAIEMGLHCTPLDQDQDELAVRSATFWGAFALDHAWSIATGSLPQSSVFPYLPVKPGIIADIEASVWVPYTDEGAPMQRSYEQPSNVRSVYKCFCELSELVHQSLYVLHSPGKPLTARVLVNIYTRYLNWYDRIPEVLRLGHNFTPAVLFAHMYYHFAILLLFRPLITFRIIGSKVLPRDVCWQAAEAIQRLLTSYSQLYTLRLTPTFVPYFVLTGTIMQLAVGATKVDGGKVPNQEQMKKAVAADPQVSKALCQGIADLTEMVPCHHFAEQALNILRYLAKKWNVDVKEGAELDVNMSDRPADNRPYASNLNFFAPNVWGGGSVGMDNGGLGPELARIQRAADSIENTMLWPFPIQGRTPLPSGELLEQAGFALL